jgi:hypothetical protein
MPGNPNPDKFIEDVIGDDAIPYQFYAFLPIVALLAENTDLRRSAWTKIATSVGLTSPWLTQAVKTKVELHALNNYLPLN